MNLLEVKNICKTYGSGETAVKALRNVSFSVPKGEYVAIVGESGSGKSTLLNMIGALDMPTSGKVLIDGKDIFSMNDRKLTVFRRRNIGFIFQQFFLLPKLSAQKNVELPLIYAGKSPRERKQRSQQFLEKVGLSDRSHHLPSELSGGQKQRVAIARALSNDPAIILADEPTGALDTKTGTQIMDLLTQLNREGKTIVMVTHEPEIADYARRKIVIRDGEITQDTTDSVRID